VANVLEEPNAYICTLKTEAAGSSEMLVKKGFTSQKTATVKEFFSTKGVTASFKKTVSYS
jgi:hypothetical protein